WQLMPLEAPQGPEQLAHNFYGPESKSGQDLIDELRNRPQLWQMVRIPLLGALLCWTRQRGRMSPVPRQKTKMLGEALKELVQVDRTDPALEVPVTVLTDLFVVLGRLACETFQGERWVVDHVALRSALESVNEVKAFGGPD